jgi:hypothetical protein
VREKIKSNKEKILSKITQNLDYYISSPQKTSTSELCDIFIQKTDQIHSNIKQISKALLGESSQQLNLLFQTQNIQSAISNFENLIKDQENNSSQPIPQQKSFFLELELSSNNKIKFAPKFNLFQQFLIKTLIHQIILI